MRKEIGTAFDLGGPVAILSRYSIRSPSMLFVALTCSNALGKPAVPFTNTNIHTHTSSPYVHTIRRICDDTKLYFTMGIDRHDCFKLLV